MTKRKILIENYSFHNGYLCVDFILDNQTYHEDFINEDKFEKFLDDKGELSYIVDRWCNYRETHFTENKIIEYDIWKKDYFDLNLVIEFLETHYNTHEIPQPLET